jgi:hypothetical protein
MTDQTALNIATLHPAVQMAAWTLVQACREAGVPLVVISALRSDAHNQRVGGAPQSYHLDQSHLTGAPGALAFDVAVLGMTRDQVPTWWWQMLGDWAEENLGLHWGGRFLWMGEADVNHFDARRWLGRDSTLSM